MQLWIVYLDPIQLLILVNCNSKLLANARMTYLPLLVTDVSLPYIQNDETALSNINLSVGSPTEKKELSDTK